MRTFESIGYFGILVLFAAVVMMRRHVEDWNGLPLTRRVFLGVSASRNWWVAYSFGYVAFVMTRYSYSFKESFPVVVVAVCLAALFSLLGVPK